MKTADFTEIVETYKKKGFNLLMTTTKIEGLSDWHRPVVEEIQLSHERDDGDTYYDTGSKSYRLTFKALMKLATAAGVMWHPTETRRIDGRNDREYVAFRAVGGMKKPEGTPVWLKAEYDLDFEVVEEEVAEGYEKKADKYDKDREGNDWWHKKSEPEKKQYLDQCIRRDILQKRKHKVKLCESGAKSRVVRELLGIKSNYSKKQIEKPFVIVRITFQPDLNDPEVKRRLLDAAVQSMSGIYGPSTPQIEAPVEIPPEDIVDVSNGSEPEFPEPEIPEPDEEQDSKRVDFENSDPDTQIKTLEELMIAKGYAEEKLQAPLIQFKASHRIKFYDLLMAMEDDDVPF